MLKYGHLLGGFPYHTQVFINLPIVLWITFAIRKRDAFSCLVLRRGLHYLTSKVSSSVFLRTHSNFKTSVESTLTFSADILCKRRPKYILVIGVTFSFPLMLSWSFQVAFPGNLQLIFILRPSQFIQRTFTEIGIKYYRDEFKMKVPVSMTFHFESVWLGQMRKMSFEQDFKVRQFCWTERKGVLGWGKRMEQSTCFICSLWKALFFVQVLRV